MFIEGRLTISPPGLHPNKIISNGKRKIQTYRSRSFCFNADRLRWCPAWTHQRNQDQLHRREAFVAEWQRGARRKGWWSPCSCLALRGQRGPFPGSTHHIWGRWAFDPRRPECNRSGGSIGRSQGLRQWEGEKSPSPIVSNLDIRSIQ